MQISENVINHIKSSIPVKAGLSVAFDKHAHTIERWIKENTQDGPLTTAKALQVIKANTSFTDADILVEELVNA